MSTQTKRRTLSRTAAFPGATRKCDPAVAALSVVSAPEIKAAVQGASVLIFFKKSGHRGVWIESQIADETDWTSLAIDSASPFADNRPPKVPGQPEKRRYRASYWDSKPSKVWTPVVEVVFGA